MTKPIVKSKKPVVKKDATPPNVEQEIVKELDEITKAFQAKKKNERDSYLQNTDTGYWTVLVFQTREQKDEFLSGVGVPLDDGDKYVDGLKVAKKLGIKIESPTPPMPKFKISPRWAKLVREEPT